MRKAALLLAVSAAALPPSIACAQGNPAPAADPYIESKTEHQKILTVPQGDSSAGIPREAYAVTASTDDNVLAFTLAPTSQGFKRGVESALNVTLKVPLGAALGGQGATVADQGLSDKFSASLSYSLIFTPFGPTKEQAGANEALRRACAAAMKEHAGRPAMSFIEPFCLKGGGVRGLTDDQLRTIAGENKEALEEVGEIIAYREKKRRAPVVLVNVTGSLGTRAYESQDPVTFTERSTDRTSVSVNATIGASLGKRRIFIGGGFQYRRDYSDPEKRVICPPGVTTDCPSEIFDLPTPDIDHTVFALTRFELPINVGGVRPLVEVRGGYDFEDKLWGVQVPVYFLTDDQGGFRGGVRFNWESRPKLPVGTTPDKPNTSIGVFFVKSFDQFAIQ